MCDDDHEYQNDEVKEGDEDAYCEMEVEDD